MNSPNHIHGLEPEIRVAKQAGRNSRMGQVLGTGLCYHEAKARYMPDDTVEDVQLALTIGQALNRLLDGKIITKINCSWG